mmetsp:Transcript_28493/g.82426  ORF Transcript_28493/g.82426 Transcript_28493/m.82426 type:complete len:393 (+) Transcript_28493:2144-3322(+)
MWLCLCGTLLQYDCCPLLLLHGFTVEGHTHSVKAIVDIHRNARNTAGHRRGEEETNVTNVVVVKILSKRSVSIGVVNGILDEGLLSGLLANGGGGTRLERASTDGVDADTVLSAGLIGEGAGVRLELGLGGGHAAAISRDYLLGCNVGKGKDGTTFVHDGSKLLNERDEGVGGGGGGGEVSLAGRLQKRLGNFGSVGEGVDEDVDLPVVGLDGLGNLADSVSVKAGITLVLLDLIGHILGSVKDSVERVNLGNLHLRTIRQGGIVAELSLPQPHLKDLKNGRPGANNDGGTSIGESPGNGPTVSRGISNASNEGDLSLQVDIGAHRKAGAATSGRGGLWLLINGRGSTERGASDSLRRSKCRRGGTKSQNSHCSGKEGGRTKHGWGWLLRST